MLTAYVAHHAELARSTPDGSTERAHLEAAARRGNVSASKMLLGPMFPTSLAYLYEWWQELSGGRTMGQFGPNSLTFEGIDAWARLTDRHPAPHEVAALFAIDVAWRSAGHAKDEETHDASAPAELKPVKAWPAKKVPNA